MARQVADEADEAREAAAKVERASWIAEAKAQRLQRP